MFGRPAHDVIVFLAGVILREGAAEALAFRPDRRTLEHFEAVCIEFRF